MAESEGFHEDVAELVSTALRQKTCRACWQVFTPRDDDDKYCSLPCKYEGWSEESAAQKNDTGLAVEFQGKRRRRKITIKAAAREMGMAYSAMRDWLQRENGRLRRENLALLAAWLGISVEVAIKLQDGTAEEHQRDIAARASAAYAEKLRSDPKAKRRANKAREPAHAAVRGKPKSEEQRRKMSAAHRAYWGSDDPDSLSDDRRTTLAEHRSKIREARGSKVEKVRRALFRWLRRCPQPSRAEQRRWAADTAEVVGMSRDMVRAICKPELVSRGLLGAAGKAPEVDHRRAIIDQTRAGWPKTSSGKAEKGFSAKIAAAIWSKERPGAPPPEGDDWDSWVKAVVQWDRRDRGARPT
jgi:hypothetical protein